MGPHYLTAAAAQWSTRKWREEDLQIDGFVPVDDVAGYGERFDVDHVDVAALRAHVQVFALERQVEADDPEKFQNKQNNPSWWNHSSIHQSINPSPRPPAVISSSAPADADSSRR